MARRRNAGILDDLVELVARLPWWAGVALAIISYVVLHRFATAEVAVATNPGRFGAVAAQQLYVTMAMFGQYLLPVILLIGAVGSAIAQWKRTQLITDVARSESAGVLGDMRWQEFEVLVGEAFRLKGYRVTETGGGGADGGVDLVVTKGSEKRLVQCKQWRAFKVGVTTIRELYGVMAAKGAAGGFVVTSGEFTGDAIEFAHGRNIELINGAQLLGMIERARQTVQSASATASPPSASRTALQQADPNPPNCPRCGQTMIWRVAKQGSNAGKPFWGCSGFPDCRGTRTAG